MKPVYQLIKQITHVITVQPSEIEIVILGDTLHNAGVNGINGTFFDTPNPVPDKSCWGLAVNKGKPIGPNAHTTDWGGLKRGVVAWNGSQMICRRINDYREIPDMVWGISGVMLLPSYDRYIEKYAEDIYRTTDHTIIGYDDSCVQLIKTYGSMADLTQLCRDLKLLGAVSLDGGGSSQLNFNGKGFKSVRKINSAVIISRR